MSDDEHKKDSPTFKLDDAAGDALKRNADAVRGMDALRIKAQAQVSMIEKAMRDANPLREAAAGITSQEINIAKKLNEAFQQVSTGIVSNPVIKHMEDAEKRSKLLNDAMGVNHTLGHISEYILPEPEPIRLNIAPHPAHETNDRLSELTQLFNEYIDQSGKMLTTLNDSIVDMAKKNSDDEKATREALSERLVEIAKGTAKDAADSQTQNQFMIKMAVASLLVTALSAGIAAWFTWWTWEKQRTDASLADVKASIERVVQQMKETHGTLEANESVLQEVLKNSKVAADKASNQPKK